MYVKITDKSHATGVLVLIGLVCEDVIRDYRETEGRGKLHTL